MEIHDDQDEEEEEDDETALTYDGEDGGDEDQDDLDDEKPPQDGAGDGLDEAEGRTPNTASNAARPQKHDAVPSYACFDSLMN